MLQCVQLHVLDNIKLGFNSRYLREVDYSLARPTRLPASVDSSTYVASRSSHYEPHFGALCWVSLLNCPWIQRQAAGLPTTANEWSISPRCLWVLFSDVLTCANLGWLFCK